MIINRLHNGAPPIHTKKQNLPVLLQYLKKLFSWSHKAVSLLEDYATELEACP